MLVAAGVRAAMRRRRHRRARRRPFRADQMPAADRRARSPRPRRAAPTTATRDTLKSMALSRAASALGVAVALGEIDRERADGMRRSAATWSLFSVARLDFGRRRTRRPRNRRARHGAGLERTAAHRSRVMADAIDIEPVRAALAGSASPRPASSAPRSAAAWSPCSPRPRRARRARCAAIATPCSNDSDISSTRHARAFVAGALAGLVGHAEIFVSGGAEHQGPDGGGPVAVIVDARRHERSRRHDATPARSPHMRPAAAVAGNDRHDQDLRLAGRARRRLDQGSRRHVPRAARRERRRQVDAGQMHHGLLLARQGATVSSTARKSRSATRATPRRSASAWSTSISRWCPR